MDVRERVIAERLARKAMSARTAATLGGIANTTWSAFENGGPITKGVRAAVAQAFTWPMDWPENPPEMVSLRSDEAEELRAELAELRQLLAEVSESDAAKGARIERLSDQLDRLSRERTARQS